MTDPTGLSTERLSLHLLTVEEGRRIVDVTPGEQDSWAEDFPMQATVTACRASWARPRPGTTPARSAATGSTRTARRSAPLPHPSPTTAR